MCARVFREGTGVGFRLVTGLWVVLGSYAGGLKPVLYIQFFFFKYISIFLSDEEAARPPPGGHPGRDAGINSEIAGHRADPEPTASG